MTSKERRAPVLEVMLVADGENGLLLLALMRSEFKDRVGSRCQDRGSRLTNQFSANFPSLPNGDCHPRLVDIPVANECLSKGATHIFIHRHGALLAEKALSRTSSPAHSGGVPRKGL